MKNLLALAAVTAFASGIALAPFAGLDVSTSIFILGISVVFFFAWLFGKRDWYLFPCIVLVFLVLGCIRFSLAPNALPAAFAPLLQTKTSIEGTVIADPDVRETSERLTVRVVREGQATNVLVVAPSYPVFEYGDTVTALGKLETPAPFETDSGRTFAYDAFLAKDEIFSTMKFAAVQKTGEDQRMLMHAQRGLFQIKHTFAKGVEQALPEPYASLAEGLLVGGKQGLGKDLLNVFTVAGLLPIIVLSGYNVMIVAEGILAVFSFVRRRVALLLATLTIFLFVFAAGGGSSATRAGLMAGLALFARATHRTYDALRILIFVFVAMLAWNPLQLMSDPGFQFSFAATLGLILFSPLLEVRLTWIRWSVLREVVATTLSAQLFVLPLLLYQTGNLSLVAIPANILELPVIPLTMLFSFIGGLVGVVLPSFALYAGLPAYALLAYIISVAEFSASLPFAQIILPEFSLVFVFLSYGAIALLVRRMKKTAQAKPARSFSTSTKQ